MQSLFWGASVVAIAVAAGSVGATPAQAQPQASGAEEKSALPATEASDRAADNPIIVTARRRQERIIDVPAAIDVLDRQAIDDQGGFFTLEDIANNTPSVNFAATTTPATAEISIRGSATARSTNAEGGVALYRNGVFVGGGRRGGRSFTRMDFLDPERIEVLRGVQGALYGRNAVGGAINLINMKPQFETSGYFRAEFGSFLRAGVDGAANLKLSDTVAVRVSGDLMEQGEGAFFNPFKGKYFDEQRARGVRGQVRFAQGALDVNFLAETSFVKNPPLVFSLNLAPSRAFPNGVFQDPYNIGWNGDSVANQYQKMAILTAKLDLGFAQISAIGSVRQRDTEHGFDSDGLDPIFLAELRANGGGLTTDAFQEALQLDQTTNKYFEIHINDLGDSPFKWLVGFEHVTIESDSQFSNTRTPTRTNPSTGSQAITELNTYANAVFGSLGYDLTDRLSATGEMRYTRERKTLISDRFDLLTGISLGSRYDFDAENKENNLSYNITLGYSFPNINGLAYARYGTGFRAGGFNDDLGDPRAPNPVVPAFDNEDVRNYEVGLKGQFIRNMNFAFAAYQVDTADNLIQVDNGCNINSDVCPVGATIFLRNAGDARVRGGEAQVDGRIPLGGGALLRINGSAGYIDAKIVTGADAGKRIPQVPDWLFTAGANLSAPVGNGARAFGNVQYSSRFGGVQEIDQVPNLESFHLVNTRVGIRFGDVEVALSANNLLDYRYKVFRTNVTQRANYPRTFGIQFVKRWRG